MLDTDAYRELAAVLSGRGIASVRYDKRGVGQSSSAAPPEVDLRFETYADDSARWLTDLGRDARFSSTIVVGHSDGSQLGMLAMEKAPAQAFISLEGSGRAAGELIREQLT